MAEDKTLKLTEDEVREIWIKRRTWEQMLDFSRLNAITEWNYMLPEARSQIHSQLIDGTFAHQSGSVGQVLGSGRLIRGAQFMETETRLPVHVDAQDRTQQATPAPPSGEFTFRRNTTTVDAIASRENSLQSKSSAKVTPKAKITRTSLVPVTASNINRRSDDPVALRSRPIEFNAPDSGESPAKLGRGYRVDSNHPNFDINGHDPYFATVQAEGRRRAKIKKITKPQEIIKKKIPPTSISADSEYAIKEEAVTCQDEQNPLPDLQGRKDAEVKVEVEKKIDPESNSTAPTSTTRRREETHQYVLLLTDEVVSMLNDGNCDEEVQDLLHRGRFGDALRLVAASVHLASNIEE